MVQKIVKLSKNENFKIIDLAMDKNDEYSQTYIENGIKNWFLECDGHWNHKGK